jgi:hypothetical protein
VLIMLAPDLFSALHLQKCKWPERFTQASTCVWIVAKRPRRKAGAALENAALQRVRKSVG